MVRTFIWLLLAIIILIIMLPVGLLIRIFESKDKFAPINGLAQWICKHLVPLYTRLAGCDYVIRGKRNLPDKPALFVGNHQGDLDVLLILFALGAPKIIIAKKEAQKVPIAHLWMTILKCIFMDRSNIRQSLKCMQRAEEYLEHGQSVLLFPEGTRSKGPNMNEFKHGSFKIALKAGVPVVPFVIDGSYKVFEAQKFLKKSKVRVSILPPVLPYEGETTAQLAQRVQNMIAKELERLRHE